VNIKEPKNPLPVGYRPAGGIARKVGDGDGWLSIAAGLGLDPWWLIQYNFETRDPAEVNWYLMHRVKCTKTTVNGRNYVFTSSDKPGIIYVPTPQAARAMRSLAYGRYGISIEGSEDYQRQVEATLNNIAVSDTGMVLLDAIKGTGKEIVISPYGGNDCNATAGPTDWRDATAPGYPIHRNDGTMAPEPSLVRDLLGLPKELAVGTGTGSNVIVRFSPSMFGFGVTGACASFAGAPGASPSQVLFHELAHAYRQAKGICNRQPTVGGSASYTDMEEFFAVVVSNVLIADPTYSSGNRTLRADHAGFQPLAPVLSTSRGFVSHIPNRNKMRELIAADPVFTKALSGVKSYFNPFAEPL